ncbi:IS1634 family transposase [Nostoc sp. CHAB 5714]|uniref:IS1634 family transposase n=1 Tax=Nostoc favosum CHAB5714 TaxID=2780399 RepID=A0ABS8IBP3_9NOSO|nr:IS1634 family transposase [Nostoc favosum CHAB5714]
MTASRLDIRVQDIDHCGIVAGICDEMELVEQINRLLGSHPQEVIDDDVLSEYKAQQSTERGFRFLKDPLFFTSSVFLNSTERVAALAMVMGLCLLVYSLGQKALRQALERAKKTIDNQLGKPTSTPTLCWVFQCFMSIHLLTVDQIKQIANLTPERQLILQFFGSPCRKYYLLS